MRKVFILALLYTSVMWWWFRKGERKPSDDNKWASLAASLKLSFSQVREDINHLTTSDTSQQQKILEFSESIHKIESRIDNLMLAINLNQQRPSEFPQRTERKENPPKISKEATLHIIENLTDTQKSILMTLAQLSKEIPSGWLSLKELATELYPNKRYNDVRTMMSEYTDRLLECGLLEKKRKGREVLVALTEKTKALETREQQPAKQHLRHQEKNTDAKPGQ